MPLECFFSADYRIIGHKLLELSLSAHSVQEVGGENESADGYSEVPSRTSCGIVAIGSDTAERQLQHGVDFAIELRVGKPLAVDRGDTV